MSRFEIVMSVLTAIYVAITGFYAWISRKTLKAIVEQELSNQKRFTEQLAEMKIAREQTIEQMRVAGEKTDQLIQHSANQTEASHIAATAAKASADALINSERAWLLVDIEHQLGKSHLLSSTGYTEDHSGVFIVIIVKNHGRSPAWITQQFIRFEIEETICKSPDFTKDLEGEKYSVPIAPGGDLKQERSLVARGRVGPNKQPIVFGVVRYTDIFGQDRSTTFGYHMSRSGNLDRMSDYPEYNKST